MSAFYGGSVPQQLQKKDFMHNVQRASLYCKWVAVSGMPAEYKEFLGASNKPNPEGSILSSLYTACEDFVITHWTSFLLEFIGPKHVSLHYDGVRISHMDSMSVETICRKSEAYIQRKTGFDVRIREKLHSLVLQSLKANASTGAPLFAEGHNLRKPGNCIPHALACLEAPAEDAAKTLADWTDQRNVYMEQRGSRTYKQCSDIFACDLEAAIVKDVTTIPSGKYLLHCENGGRPRCVAVHIHEEEAKVTVWDLDGVYTVSRADLDIALLGGVDASTCVFFSLGKGVWEDDREGFERLLDLAAGSSGSDVLLEVDSEQLSEGDPQEPEVEAGREPAEVTEFQWLDESGVVVIEDVLLHEFGKEVQKCMEQASFKASRGAIACPLCPFRSFNRAQYLLNHLRRRRTKKKQYCCSGTKQLRVALALHDAEQLRRSRGQNYLRRSADCLRSSIRPTLSPSQNAIDKHVRMVLDGNGPKLVHADYLKAGVTARRVGRLWYTHSFAEQVREEMLLQQGKAGASLCELFTHRVRCKACYCN